MGDRPGIVVTGASGRMGRMLSGWSPRRTGRGLSGGVERPGHDWIGQDIGTALGGQPWA